MNIFEWLQESLSRFAAPKVASLYNRRYADIKNRSDYLEESMNAVTLELENLQYQRMASFQSEYLYTQRHVHNIIKLTYQMAMKNPITVRSIKVQADYVFGQGVSFIAKHPYIKEVIDEFLNYPDNQKVLTSHSAMLRQEKRQQVYGSIFFALYTNTKTGRVIVRTIPTLEVADIITDPEDREKEWYIKRSYTTDGEAKTVYFPCLGVDQYSGIPLPWNVSTSQDGVVNYPQGQIVWNAPVLHVANNKLGEEKFAVPELYPQLDWATAYKRTLEQWISIIASFARMAMKVTGLSGKKQAAAAKAMLNTQIGLSNPLEANPSPVAGSIPMLGGNVDIAPIKTAGATTPASDAEPILNMAGCAHGLPNTFYGDAGKGNFATAKTLDRPTELKMISRQKQWKEIFTAILDYAIYASVVAPEGILKQYGATYQEIEDVFSGLVILALAMPPNKDPKYGETGQPIDRSYEIHFPEILERNVADRVRSLVNAVTLFGKPLMDIIPDKRMVSLLLLQALNVENAESYIPMFVEMWEANMKVEDGKPVEAHIIPPPPPGGSKGGAEDPSQGGDVGENG